MTLQEQRKQIEQAQTLDELGRMLYIAETGELQALICKRETEILGGRS